MRWEGKMTITGGYIFQGSADEMVNIVGADGGAKESKEK